MSQRLVSEFAARSLDVRVFSADAWVLAEHGDAFQVEQFPTVGDAVKERIWRAASAALAANHSVVLDFSFWSRTERALWRARATEAGAVRVVTLSSQCSVAECRARLEARNAAPRQRGDFRVPLATFDQWAALFEQPDSNEPDAHTIACSRTDAFGVSDFL